MCTSTYAHTGVYAYDTRQEGKGTETHLMETRMVHAAAHASINTAWYSTLKLRMYAPSTKPVR